VEQAVEIAQTVLREGAVSPVRGHAGRGKAEPPGAG
jgi:hypothetical protein